jgi:hypothetical protein
MRLPLNPGQPLWLPQGSVRGILALVAGAVFGTMALVGTLPAEASERILGIVFTAYFVQKVAGK